MGSNAITTNRNVGLDIARISAMCGIIILHILGQGGELAACNTNSIAYWVSWWIEICAFCSVDIFALLSGWLGIFKNNNSCFRTLELIMITLFYSIIITIVFVIVAPQVFNGFGDVVRSIIPALAGRYWYLTCYLAIAILQPFINKMLLALTIKQHKMVCILASILFSVFPSFFQIDFFAFEDGYSSVWLLVCYVIGAYLRRTETENLKFFSGVKGILVFLIGSLVLLVGNILIYTVFESNWQYLVSYISPIIVLMSVIFLISMKNLHFKKENKFIKHLSMAAFDVYIIHCHILIFDFVLKERFAWMANMDTYLIILLVLACTIVLYIVLAFIGIARSHLFKITRLNQICRFVSFKVDSVIYKNV